MPTDRWYLVVIERVTDMNFLVQADTPEEARKKIVLPGQKYRIDRLNWAAVKKLTGCMIPHQYQADDYASGSLAFLREGRVITLVT